MTNNNPPNLPPPWQDLPRVRPLLAEHLIEAVRRPAAHPTAAFLALGRVVRASALPAAQLREAWAWLAEHGRGDVLSVVASVVDARLELGWLGLRAWACRTQAAREAWEYHESLEPLGDEAAPPEGPPDTWLWHVAALRDDCESVRVAVRIAALLAVDPRDRAWVADHDAALGAFDAVGSVLVGEIIAALRDSSMPMLVAWLPRLAEQEPEFWWLHAVRIAEASRDRPMIRFGVKP